MNSRVLFICTGNFYRSRFAELLFNSLASTIDLNWLAFSRGTNVRPKPSNFGPIARETIDGLRARGIEIEATHPPIQLQELHLAVANLIVAVNEIEHRPSLERQFPDWKAKIEYWNIHDIDLVPADEALFQIEREVTSLIARLSSPSIER